MQEVQRRSFSFFGCSPGGLWWLWLAGPCSGPELCPPSLPLVFTGHTGDVSVSPGTAVPQHLFFSKLSLMVAMQRRALVWCIFCYEAPVIVPCHHPSVPSHQVSSSPRAGGACARSGAAGAIGAARSVFLSAAPDTVSSAQSMAGGIGSWCHRLRMVFG